MVFTVGIWRVVFTCVGSFLIPSLLHTPKRSGANWRPKATFESVQHILGSCAEIRRSLTLNPFNMVSTSFSLRRPTEAAELGAPFASPGGLH